MGFLSKLRNKVKSKIQPEGKRRSSPPPRRPGNMPTDRQNAFVNPVRPGMIPQLPGRVGLTDANGYNQGDDRYGGGFTRGPRNDFGVPGPALPMPPQIPRPPRPPMPKPGMNKKDYYKMLLAQGFEIPTGMIKDPPRGGFSPKTYPMQELRAGTSMPNSPRLDTSSSPRMPAPPAIFDRSTAPVLKRGIPSLPQNPDFVSKLLPNFMPEMDFSNLPQMAGNPNIPAPDGYELRDNEGKNYFRELLSPEDQAQNTIPRGIDIPFQDFNLKNMRPGFVNGRDVNIDDGGMVDFLNSDPQQKLFGIENRIEMLLNQKQEAEANGDQQSFDMIVQEINNADAQRIEIMNSMNPRVDRMEAGRGRTLSNRDREIGRTLSNRDREILGETGRTISNMDRGYIDDILSSLEKKN